MTANAKVDRDKLHAALFKKANPNDHMLEIRLVDLAELLEIRSDHLGRIIKEMVEAGRLKKMHTARHRVSTYKIVDPGVWAGGKKPVAGKRELKWG